MIVALLILIPSLAWGQSYACPHEVAVSVEPHVATVHEVAGCSSIAAPNWAGDSRWLIIVHLEEADCTGLWADASPRGNPLTPGTGDCVMDVNIVRQGSRSYNSTFTSSERRCLAVDGCTPSDFAFTSGSFTAGGWIRPTEAMTGIVGLTWRTDDNPAGFPSDGGWYMALSDTSNLYIFAIHSGVSETTIASTTAWAIDTYGHHIARYTSSSGLMEQLVNGVVQAATNTSTAPNAGDGIFTLGKSSGDAVKGQHDEWWVWGGELSNEDSQRVAVCHTDGTGCRCDAKAPTDYASRPLHVSEGGPIAGTMPACNKAGPT